MDTDPEGDVPNQLELLARIEARFRSDPVVLLLGPRQRGKTTLARQFAGGRKAETRQRQGRVFRLEVETRFHCASGQQILSAQQMGRSRGHSRFESACAESCLIQSCRCDCRNDHEKHETRINCQFHGIHPVSEAAYLLKLFLFISCFSRLSWFEPPLSGSFPLRPRRARNDKSPATSRPPGSASFPDLD